MLKKQRITRSADNTLKKKNNLKIFTLLTIWWNCLKNVYFFTYIYTFCKYMYSLSAWYAWSHTCISTSICAKEMFLKCDVMCTCSMVCVGDLIFRLRTLIKLLTFVKMGRSLFDNIFCLSFDIEKNKSSKKT